MPKITLIDVGSLGNPSSARQKMNQNFDAIEAAFDQVLDRMGRDPNEMEAELDMNSHKILNVADPENDNDAVNRRSVRPLVEEFASDIIANAVFGDIVVDSFTATAGQTTFTLSESPGSVLNTEVYIDGVAQAPTTDYTLNGSNLRTLTFFSPLALNQKVMVRYAKALPSGITAAASVTYTPPVTGVGGTVKDYLDTIGSSTGAGQVGFSQSLTGATTRTLLDKVRERVSVFDFMTAAQIADVRGGTLALDVTSAVQAAITACTQAANPIELFFPRGKYKITSALTFNGILIATGAGFVAAELVVTNNTDVFSGTFGYFRNLKISHSGAGGTSFVMKGDASCVDECVVVSSSPDPAVKMFASNQAVRNCMFSCSASATISVLTDNTISALNINSRITGNTMYGSGSGVSVKVQAGTARVEGLNVSGNKIVTTGTYHVYIEQVLHMTLNDNVMDQGSTYGLRFEPMGSGIDGVIVTGNYIATAANASAGLAVSAGSGVAGVRGVTLANNFIGFSGYGIDMGGNVSELNITSNFFDSINNYSIGLGSNPGCTISGNTFRGANIHLLVSDGATGRYSITNNVFPTTGSVSYTPTNRLNFQFSGNIGKSFSGWSGVTFTTSGGSSSVVAVPHGLAVTPDINKISGSVVQLTGGHVTTSFKVISVDATNITAEVFYGQVVAGNLRLNLFASA